MSISLERVSKSYGQRTALSPISLSIEDGETVAIVGPSGSGKTTLLHLIAGVTQPDGGNVTLRGKKLADLDHGRDLSSLVGVIHQQFDLVPNLSVVHNVLAGRLGEWGLWRSLISLVSPRDRHLAERALERVGLADRMYERTSRLSGGEQQRVAIARLLVQDPAIIVADEPVASLDPARADDLVRLLAVIAEESSKTLVAALHSIDLARTYFSRVIGLRNGGVQFDLPIEQLTDEMLSELYDLTGLDEPDGLVDASALQTGDGQRLSPKGR